jgi:protein-tyrosine phosphatase
MTQLAKKNGVKLESRARRIEPVDFERFDLLVCMDQENHSNLVRMGAPKKKLHLLLDFHAASTESDVPDPYYGGEDEFDRVYRLVDAACEALLDELLPDSRQPESG